jgi:putative RecB family exonuclease
MEFTPDSMIYGTVIHHSLECYYFEKKFGKVLSLKQVHEAFQEFWAMEVKKHDDIQYSKGKNYQSYIIDGKALLSAWYNQLPEDNFNVIGVEERFSFEIPGLPIEIIGFIDLLEEEESKKTLIITDFKTSAKAYSASEIDKNMQLLIYQMAMKANGYSDREILLRLDCLIKTKTP